MNRNAVRGEENGSLTGWNVGGIGTQMNRN